MLIFRQRLGHRLNIFGQTAVYVGIAAAIAVILPALYMGFLRVSGNFHAVIAGSIYRSAQPSEDSLKRYSRTNGIRSVLNLRAVDVAQDDERHTAERLGLSYYHIPLSAMRMPTAVDIAAIKKILAEAPRPILVHSYFGADRAGLVSALDLLMIEERSMLKAKEQLSFMYGHLDFPGNPTIAMDQTLEAVATVYHRTN
jgi:protein tyrosine/serine phosphatase